MNPSTALFQANPNKRRKVESDSLSADATEAEKTRNQAERYPGETEGSSESQQGLPRGKRKKGWKRSRHEMKASSDKNTRKRPNMNSSSEDDDAAAAAASLSDSSSNPMDDEESPDDNSSGGDRQPKSTDSGS